MFRGWKESPWVLGEVGRVRHRGGKLGERPRDEEGVSVPYSRENQADAVVLDKSH